MKKFFLLMVMSWMLVPAFATNHPTMTMDNPTGDTVFRTDTATVMEGYKLLIDLQAEGWTLYNAFRLDADRVVITTFRINGIKSSEDMDTVDGFYISEFKTLSGKKVRIEIEVRDGKIINISQTDIDRDTY